MRSLLRVAAVVAALSLCTLPASAQVVAPVPAQPAASTYGGAQPFFNDAVAGTVVQVKASTGQLYSLSLTNTTAATAYLQVFCKPSASVTLGTTVADFTFRLKTNAGAGDQRDMTFPVGIGCSAGTGLSLAGTTTATGSTGAAISVSASYL